MFGVRHCLQFAFAECVGEVTVLYFNIVLFLRCVGLLYALSSKEVCVLGL